MRWFSLFLLSVCIAILVVPSARTVGVSALDLDQLTNDSDLIVVGKVNLVREIGGTHVTVFSQGYTARILTAVVHVDRLLKGTLSSDSASFQFYVPDEYVGWKSVTVNTYAVFYLMSDSKGGWVFTNPYYPSTPALPGSSLSSSTAIDRVIEVTEAVLHSPTTVLNQKLAAVQVISSSRSPASDAALRSALSLEDKDVRLGVAAVLLHRNDNSGLALATHALLEEPSRIPEGIRLGLLAGIGTWLRDPTAVDSLVELTKSPSSDIREAAAEGLWRTHSQNAILPLLSMLSDSDKRVRYFSVVGLAEITDQLEWRPNPDDFAGSETKYVQHWIEWGRNR